MIKETIKELLLTNTGQALGDSGDIYGRHYERNQKDGIQQDGVKVQAYKYNDGDIEIIHYISLYEYLTTHLELDEMCEKIQNDIENRVDNLYNIHEVQNFLENTYPESDYIKIQWCNTYNTQHLLTQDIQFICFKAFDEDYVLLQIHNGCDIRGGYTYPMVFKTNHEDFLCCYDVCNVSCDCGENSYYVYCVEELEDFNKDGVYIDEDNYLRCKKCNTVLKSYIN